MKAYGFGKSIILPHVRDVRNGNRKSWWYFMQCGKDRRETFDPGMWQYGWLRFLPMIWN